MKEGKLNRIIEMIPIFKNMVDEDLAISVWDRDGVVLYFSKSESFPLHFDIGYQLEDKDDPLYTAMREGKIIHTAVPKEVFGVNIEGNLVPVFDNGKVIGCIASVYSLEEFGSLRSTNNLMKEMIKKSDSSIESILTSSTKTVTELKEVTNFVEILEQNLKDVYSVVDLIKGNANSTKMLALNASIEASKAGDGGRGFKIVASEMGKLSQMSKDSITSINNSLNNISKSIGDVTHSIKSINVSALENLDVVETISTNLSKMSSSLNDIK